MTITERLDHINNELTALNQQIEKDLPDKYSLYFQGMVISAQQITTGMSLCIAEQGLEAPPSQGLRDTIQSEVDWGQVFP